MSDWYNKYVSSPVSKVGSYIGLPSLTKKEKVIETIIKHEYQKMEPIGYHSFPCSSRRFLKIAAISGLTAVVMSAYGSHGSPHSI